VQKEKTPENGFAFFEETISHEFYGHDIYIFIAESTGFGLMISKRNLEFFELYFFMLEGSQLIHA